MRPWLNKISLRLAPLKFYAEHYASPLVLFAMRITVARVFLTSGGLKFGYVLHNQLDTLYFLFEDYKVPLLPAKVAAWMGMGGELGFGLLLLLGLFGRVGALGLIFMSAVIFNTDHNPLAIYWALICAVVAVWGPGKISVDALIFKPKAQSGDSATIH